MYINFILLRYMIYYFLAYSQGYSLTTTIKFQNIFITPKRHSLPSPCPQPLVTNNLLSFSMDYTFWKFHINEII